MASTGTSRIEGIDPAVAIKAPCVVATTANITLSGAQTIDAVAVAETTIPTRVLVKDQTDNTENGVYDVKGTAWVRSEDFDGARDVVDGTLVSISQGVSSGNTTWRVNATNPVSMGTSAITFSLTQTLDESTTLEATGDGADRTAELLDANYTAFSDIKLGSGVFLMNKWMQEQHLRGSGYSTEIKPFSAATNGGFALTVGKADKYTAFDTMWIRDMAIDGLDDGCIKFETEGVAEGSDLSTGGWLLENLTLRAREGAGGLGSKCVKIERGSIGNIFNNISTSGCDFAFWLQNNQSSIQHTGANTWNHLHAQRADKAAIYIRDEQDGRGNWTINQGIIEQNAGFGIFAISAPEQVQANISPFTVNQLWFEKNGLESTPTPPSTVTIDSVVYTPRDMRFESFGSVVLNGTWTKNLDVVDSDVACYDCRMDGDQTPAQYFMGKDKDSTITLTNPSGATTYGKVDQWSHTASASIPTYGAGKSPLLRMEHRRVRAQATVRTSNSLGFEKVITGNYSFGSSMTGVQVTDGILFDTCLETTTIANTTTLGQISETATSVGGITGLSTPTVTGITQANPAVVSATAHGYVDNQLVSFVAGAGMEELSGNHYIDYIDADNYSIRGVDSTAYTAWSAAGTFAARTSWVIMSVATKVMSGLANIDKIEWTNGSFGRVGDIRTGVIDEWVTTVCMVNMSKTGTSFASSSLQVDTNSGGSAVVRFADFQVVAFATKQEAADFIHSGIFEYTSGEELTITPDTVTDTAAISLLTEQSNLVTTGSHFPTLADGFEGQIKTIYHKTYAGGAGITPANMHGGASIATTAAGQSVVFKFTDSKWLLVGNPYGLTIS